MIDQEELPPLARPLAMVGLVLALAYGLIVVADLLPLRPGDPAWISRACLGLARWAFLPLLGTVLVHLAVLLNPHDPVLLRRLRRFRRAAAPACLALLLLIPLQGHGLIRALELSAATAAQGREAARLRFARLRNVATTASDPAALQEGLTALRGPQLPPAALALPLPRLRRQVLVELRLAEEEVLGRLERLPRQRVLERGLIELLQVSGLVVLQALALAALAEAPGGAARAPSLLAALGRRFARPRRKGATRPDDPQRYLEGLAASEAPPPAGGDQPR